jgi:hypothetical protein
VGRGEKEDEKILTAPLTFVLSRKGREELKEYPLTLPSPAAGRGKKMKRFKQCPLTLALSRKVEREEKEGKGF